MRDLFTMEDMITTNGISSITNETGERYVGYLKSLKCPLFLFTEIILLKDQLICY